MTFKPHCFITRIPRPRVTLLCLHSACFAKEQELRCQHQTTFSLKQAVSKQYHDRSASKPHSPLRFGSSIYAKPPATQKSWPWLCGMIISQDTPRSYTIQTLNNSICTNCVHIKQAVPPPNLPTLASTPLSSHNPYPPSRNCPTAS